MTLRDGSVDQPRVDAAPIVTMQSTAHANHAQALPPSAAE